MPTAAYARDVSAATETSRRIVEPCSTARSVPPFPGPAGPVRHHGLAARHRVALRQRRDARPPPRAGRGAAAPNSTPPRCCTIARRRGRARTCRATRYVPVAVLAAATGVAPDLAAAVADVRIVAAAYHPGTDAPGADAALSRLLARLPPGEPSTSRSTSRCSSRRARRRPASSRRRAPRQGDEAPRSRRLRSSSSTSRAARSAPAAGLPGQRARLRTRGGRRDDRVRGPAPPGRPAAAAERVGRRVGRGARRGRVRRDRDDEPRRRGRRRQARRDRATRGRRRSRSHTGSPASTAT